MLLARYVVNERGMDAQVHPYPAVIYQNVLHLEVCLLYETAQLVTSYDVRIMIHTCSASSLLSNSINAYCNESPVRLSRITWQLMIVPKREKMSSRSSSRVTALSLHTNKTFSGGRTFAKGKSPTISKVSADARAACLRRSASASSSGNVASGSSSSAIRAELSGGFVGIESGTTRPSGSSKGSSGGIPV